MDHPKRRGRPPKVINAAREAEAPAFNLPIQTYQLRIKAGTLQQAWSHSNGTQWRPVPVVPDTAPDWEDA